MHKTQLSPRSRMVKNQIAQKPRNGGVPVCADPPGPKFGTRFTPGRVAVVAEIS